MQPSFVRKLARFGGVLSAVARCLSTHPATAQEQALATPTPEITAAPQARVVGLGQPVIRVEVINEGRLWHDTIPVTRIQLGEPYSDEVARRAMRELLDTGRYATARAKTAATEQGVVLQLVVESRRIVTGISISGSPVSTDDLREAAHLRSVAAVGESDLGELSEEVRQALVVRGFPQAKVTAEAISTGSDLQVLLSFTISPGLPALVDFLSFQVSPLPASPELQQLLKAYGLQKSERLDQEVIDRADRELERELRHQGWHRAVISHRIVQAAQFTHLIVVVQAGAHVTIGFEGPESFGADELSDVLDLDSSEDLSPGGMAERLRSFYERRGFLDAQVKYRIDGLGTRSERLVFLIREQSRVRVIGREYPCLTGSRTASRIGEEIDSFLSEDLPGADVLGPVDPTRVDQALGPHGTAGTRPKPPDINPWTTYDASVYERATQHVQDLYRSEGYLSATVGPTQVLRRRCDPHTMPGSCQPIGDRRRPKTLCAYDDVGWPIEEPASDPKLGCIADPARGVECEPTAILHIPIKLGPRTILWDVAFEGNTRLSDQELWDATGLILGSPASFADVEQARRRLLDAYAEAGFAFADLSTTLDLSPNRRRARLRISIREGEQVRVSAIYVRGANITKESLIRSRVALKVGQPYRASDVRATEEHLATLGVFSSVRVGFEDPYVPAREKVVVVEVAERIPQYFETRPGLSSGEGLRLALEYGHLNLFHQAIQLRIRTQFGYLPSEFILDDEVRRSYEQDPALKSIWGRMTRQNSLAVTFPDIGLGPLFRLRVEGLDVQRNTRDFQLVKEANINTLSFLPSRRLTVELGGSLELNKICIFMTDCQDPTQLADYITNHSNFTNLFRVPAGSSLAITQKASISWDRRNVPLDATSGTFLNFTVEHVTAFPTGSFSDTIATGAGDVSNPFRPINSEFLRATNRVAGYLPIGKGGAALAISFRWGLNVQLKSNSSTYPDRLFFAGGVDSIRGFLQDSLIPEDMAQRILRGELELGKVVVRGGDFFVNPRAELRVPLTHTVHTVLFLDSGNVWTQTPSWLTLFTPGTTTVAQAPNAAGAQAAPMSRVTNNYWRWRYSIGTGLRLGTPIGPLAFDYGFNVEQILDRLGYSSPGGRRTWEDLGAFHFSIGLF